MELYIISWYRLCLNLDLSTSFIPHQVTKIVSNKAPLIMQIHITFCSYVQNRTEWSLPFWVVSRNFDLIISVLQETIDSGL